MKRSSKRCKTYHIGVLTPTCQITISSTKSGKDGLYLVQDEHIEIDANVDVSRDQKKYRDIHEKMSGLETSIVSDEQEAPGLSSSLAGTLLQSWGWNLPTDKEIERFTCPDADKVIVVISHTSYWDFFLLLMYRAADPRIKQNLHLVIKPQVFDVWGWFLKPLGCIPSTRAEESGNGFINNTVAKYKNRNIRLILSPEGKMSATPWRSGYYHLVKGFKCSVMVSGLDYEKKRLYIGKPRPWCDIKDLSKERLEQDLQEEMGQIVPLHVEGSFSPVTRPYDRNEVYPVKMVPFTLSVVFVVLVIALIVMLVIYLIHYSWSRF